MQLYTDATGTIIDPTRKTTRTVVLMGPLEKLSQERFSGPLTLGLSLFVVMPYILLLIAITAVCFAISYTIFMRQEIRSL
jgi:ABC-2 type transport system permease protein